MDARCANDFAGHVEARRDSVPARTKVGSRLIQLKAKRFVYRAGLERDRVVDETGGQNGCLRPARLAAFHLDEMDFYRRSTIA